MKCFKIIEVIIMYLGKCPKIEYGCHFHGMLTLLHHSSFVFKPVSILNILYCINAMLDFIIFPPHTLSPII